ncbi:MAG: hypothetical protein AAF772_14990 [Acidobacteriota bacterium]
MPTIARRRSGKRRSDGPSTTKRGYGHRYREVRARILRAQDRCQDCLMGVHGPPRLCAADEVHHEPPIGVRRRDGIPDHATGVLRLTRTPRHGEVRLWQPTKPGGPVMVPLCRECHRLRHGRHTR